MRKILFAFGIAWGLVGTLHTILEAEPCLTINEKYTSLGGNSGILGVPTSEESPTADGIGRYRDYQWGSIYWIPQTCAHEIHVPIKDKWISLNAERGLGYPITDVMRPPGSERLPAATVPLWSYLQRGAIYALPRRPEGDGRGSVTYEVHGSIWEKYRALGAEHTFLRYPVTDETSTPDGTGRFNHFQHGSIYWTPQTGAHEVHGAIKDKWASLGWERSLLGYPVTDEMDQPTNDYGTGRFNNFQHGSIYWTLQTGAHEVHGKIRDQWLAVGGAIGFGFPTSDEMPIPNCDGRVSRFQGGSIYWTPRGSTPQGSTLVVYGDDGSGPPPRDICPGSPPPPSETGTLTGSYFFDAIGIEPFDMTVIFTGTLASASGSNGQTTFSVTETTRITPGAGAEHVDFSVSGLRRGTWTVTATPRAVAGPMTCQATVPGIVFLNVSGGRTSCSSP